MNHAQQIDDALIKADALVEEARSRMVAAQSARTTDAFSEARKEFTDLYRAALKIRRIRDQLPERSEVPL